MRFGNITYEATEIYVEEAQRLLEWVENALCMCSTILSRVALDSLYGFRLDVHKTGQAILADLDSFVLLFDRYCPFHGEISIVDGESTLPKERFNHGESVYL